MAEDGSPQTFKTLGVREELVEACESLGWKAPTKIQIESIPYALEGILSLVAFLVTFHDVLVLLSSRLFSGFFFI